SGKAELVVLYGRRRVGKTFLLENSFPDALFLTADLSESKALINRFSKPLKQLLGLPETIAVTHWDTFFDLLGQALRRNNGLVVVWDEFQYIPQRDPAFLSVFQRWWDQTFCKMPVTMVLCGSFIGMMEKLALAQNSPLYGRRTAQYHLQPLDFFSAQQFAPLMTPADRVSLYSITGGIPLYLKQFSEYSSLEQGLLDKTLAPGEFLVEEGRFIVLEEFKKDPTTYFSILRIVASGRTRSSEIAQLTGVPHHNLPPYLRNLINLRLLSREYPFSLKQPKNRPLYFIGDEYLRFYFRYLSSAQELIYRERGQDVLKQVLVSLPEHVSFVFEKICRSWLAKTVSPESMGRWWDKNEELDIAAVSGDTLFAAECKWTNQPVGRKTHGNLLRKTALLDQALGKEWGATQYYLFSKSGFRDIAESPGLHLVDLERMAE
ncbi:MAG: ATP-binding protein, partial [Synergistota bacterium]|nr:ATP-binding protein [Synergistota bacterium]